MDGYFIMNGLLLLFLIATAVSVAVTRDLLFAIVMLGIFSLLMAVLYLVMGAADVAITEAAVGAGISTILLLCTVALTGREEKTVRKGNNLVPLLLVVAMGGALIYATMDMPHFGDPTAPIHQHVAPHYLAHTEKEIGIPNVVTAVLASYRGYDTLGETTVIFTAAMSVLLLIGNLFQVKKKG